MKIKIGTRRSSLALAQTGMVAEKLQKIIPNAEIKFIHITTKGDKILDKPLTAIGGKGVFVSEIESALQNGLIDIAVHSAKDLPVSLAEGLEISGVLERGNYRDTIITLKNRPIENTAEFNIGTGSLRRKVNLQRLYPNVTVKDIRGNVETRLKKLENGEYSAIVLAAAGIERLDLQNFDKFDFTYFDYKDFLPAPCQGIIAIESRKNDFITSVIEKINDATTFQCFETERAFLVSLNASCDTPIGAYSFVEGTRIFASLSKDRNIVHGSAEIANRFHLVRELISKL